MCRVSFEKRHPRLRISGACGASDEVSILRAVQQAVREGSTLVVDLTAATDLTPELAAALLDAQDTAPQCRVALVRKRGTVVDRRFQDAMRTRGLTAQDPPLG